MSATHPGVTAATVSLFIAGRPAPQGSKTRTRWAMRDANAATLHPWRDAVRHEVQVHCGPPWTPLDEPVAAWVVFTLPRPASLPRKRRWPVGARTGDIDKLLRAVLDGCTDGGLWVDDSRVVVVSAMKVFVGEPGAADTPGASLVVAPVLHTPPAGIPTEDV